MQNWNYYATKYQNDNYIFHVNGSASESNPTFQVSRFGYLSFYLTSK